MFFVFLFLFKFFIVFQHFQGIFSDQLGPSSELVGVLKKKHEGQTFHLLLLKGGGPQLRSSNGVSLNFPVVFHTQNKAKGKRAA